jgi:transposase
LRPNGLAAAGHRCTAGDPRIGLLTAVTLVAEAGDLRRFATARQLMA